MVKAILLVLLVAGIAPSPGTVSLVDDTGQAITLPRPASRLISLAPSLTELAYEAGAGDRLIGTVEYSDYPPAALRVPRIGTNQRLDLERIARLKPDLILAWFHGNAIREVDQLATLGIPLFHLEPRHIPDVADAIERIGQIANIRPIATLAATRFRDRYASLRVQFSERPKIRVFYQIAAHPLLTINDRQIISDVIRLCGGQNVFGNESALVPQLSTESVVAADPDIILTARMGKDDMDTVTAKRSPNAPDLRMWSKFSSMKAVRNGQLWLIPGDAISRPGPRILDGAEAVCSALAEARKTR